MYLTQSLHRALQQAPDRVMTVCGDRVRTVREVADRVARLAGAFGELGVRREDRIGILALNSDVYHEALYASWWAGAAANPVNVRWSPAEIAYSLLDAGTTVLLVDDVFAALVPALRAQCPQLRGVIHCGQAATPDGLLGYERLIAEATPVEDARADGDTLAALLYTGGTTGRPKGVMIGHRGLMTSSMGTLVANRTATRDGANLVIAPLFHIAAIAGWNGQNIVGGTQVFLPTFSPEAFLNAVEHHRITSATLVPTMMQLLCDDPRAKDHDLSSVETIGYGGSSITEAVLGRVMSVFPQAGLGQGYGMTETGVVTVLSREDHALGGARLRSAGRATPHADIRVVGADGAELPVGQAGEVITRGDHLMLGYWNRPEETAETIRDGWLHTGDIGHLDQDGYLYVVDRLKDMIISGGENVYSAEVENAVATHPAVAACAVIGVPDAEWGERVHAVVTLHPGATATPEEIREHAKGLIAGYKAPRSVEFVPTLPVSAAGKILKRDLRDAYDKNREAAAE